MAGKICILDTENMYFNRKSSRKCGYILRFKIWETCRTEFKLI